MHRLHPEQAEALRTVWHESTRTGELVDAPLFRKRHKNWQGLKVSDLAQQLHLAPESLAFSLQHLKDALIAWCD